MRTRPTLDTTKSSKPIGGCMSPIDALLAACRRHGKTAGFLAVDGRWPGGCDSKAPRAASVLHGFVLVA